MPYKSQKQRAFFHTDTARKQGISADTVREFDSASKGIKLPKKLKGRAYAKGRSFSKGR